MHLRWIQNAPKDDVYTAKYSRKQLKIFYYAISHKQNHFRGAAAHPHAAKRQSPCFSGSTWVEAECLHPVGAPFLIQPAFSIPESNGKVLDKIGHGLISKYS